MLEENSFRGHTADFVVMFLFGSCAMVVFALFVNLLFLGKLSTKILGISSKSQSNLYVSPKNYCVQLTKLEITLVTSIQI